MGGISLQNFYLKFSGKVNNGKGNRLFDAENNWLIIIK